MEKENPFGQFGSWERLLYFGKTKDPELTFNRPAWHENVGREVQAAHEEAAIFDQSTFGKIDVIGESASSFLNRVCANKWTALPVRQFIPLCQMSEVDLKVI